MGEEEYKNIIQDNIIMELNDDDPSSKLLGVQIDIDLEDANYAQTECQFRYCGTAIPFLTVRR